MKFRCRVRQQIYQTTTITVDAPDEDEARNAAIEVLLGGNIRGWKYAGTGELRIDSVELKKKGG